MTHHDQQILDRWQSLARQYGSDIANRLLDQPASNDNDDTLDRELEAVAREISNG